MTFLIVNPICTSFKPTYGRVSRKGLIAYASSTDCIGPIAETVTDAAAVAAVISGPDPDGDATCSMMPVDNWVNTTFYTFYLSVLSHYISFSLP